MRPPDAKVESIGLHACALSQGLGLQKFRQQKSKSSSSRRNDPFTNEFYVSRYDDDVQNMTDDGWEELGRDISNNTHLKNVYLNEAAKIPFFFRGLTRSNTIKYMHFDENGLSTAGVLSMVPFLQNANNLLELELTDNNIQSEGFNAMFRALSDSPIEALHCDNCGIEAIEIDRNYVPKCLTTLRLKGNRINAGGCRGVAALLQGANSMLGKLFLCNNDINDDGVEHRWRF